MTLVQLDLQSLQVLDDGRLREAFEQELKHIVLDLGDRPGDDRERNVTLKVSMKPVTDDTGQCESVNVQVQIGSKLPSRKSRVYDMAMRKSQRGPMLVYNELSLDNADQETLLLTVRVTSNHVCRIDRSNRRLGR